LQQIEHIGYGNKLFQFLLRQPNAEAALDLGNDADNIHRVQAKSFAQIGVVIEVGILFAGIGFQQFDERLANRLAVRHGPPSWHQQSSQKRGHRAARIGVRKTTFYGFGKSAYRWTRVNSSTTRWPPSSASCRTMRF